MIDGRKHTVAIVGGGASGTLLSYQLWKQNPDLLVLLIDDRPVPGIGLAYGTPSARHLLNVPAGKISALPEQPDHFLKWLRTHHDPEADADTFASRIIFGDYLRQLLASANSVVEVKGQVNRCELEGAGVQLQNSDGRIIRADSVVLAIGNLEPKQLPDVHPEVIANGIYRNNAWDPNTYADLKSDSSVVLVGTGLTCVDVLLRLRELQHHGKVIALSRRGSFPERHAPHLVPDNPVVPLDIEPKTSRCLVKAFHAALTSGLDWRGAIDSLRSTSNDLWLSLPVAEQKRFRRHLQRRWDVLRHRMAPCIAEALHQELASGCLKVCPGQVTRIQPKTTFEAEVCIQSKQGNETIAANRVINCTGPSLDYRAAESPLLQNLFIQGLVKAGPLGNGLASARSGALISATGNVSEVLFTLGPSRQGTLFESIAIPEIAEQATELAQLLVRDLAHSGEGAN